MEHEKIAEEIKKARDGKGFTQQEMANLLHFSLRNYQHIESGRFPKYKTESIKEIEKLLNIEIYDKIYNTTNVSHGTVVNEPETNYLLTRREKKNSPNTFLVPFVDIPAQAGYTKAYGNIDYIQTLKQYPILPDIDPTGAVWRYFQVQGDSMEDEIRDKDVLLASLVPQMDWTDIKDYYTHVVVTDEELLIKDILKEDQEHVILLSQNPAYKARRFKLEDIRQIWVMRRHIKNRAKKSRMYNIEEIKKELK